MHEMPRKILAAMPLENLQTLLQEINRTRRRVFVFGLNGASVVVSRRVAKELVTAAIAVDQEGAAP